MSVKIVGENCCGCRTCKTVCKFDAVAVVMDRYGFEQISIDADKCVECGACEEVCPAIHVPVSIEKHSSGAAYALDAKVREQGSSGGLFGVFARRTVLNGGCVYGAAFDDSLKLKTRSAETLDELVKLYKSKYLLCDTDDKFIEIKQKLDTGRQVLYCSSPCQVSALRLFLKKSYDNLLTVEFVCHGVGSQSLFDKSINYSEERMSSRIRRVIFRYKEKNKRASSHYYLYGCENKKKNFNKHGLYLFFPYYNAYCKQLVCRDACYDCRYAVEARGADITVGDFHGIEKYDPSIDRFAGVSMFVCNTVKGQAFFDMVRSELFVEDFDWELLKANNRFRPGSGRPKEQRRFMESVATEPFDITVKKYLRPIKDWKRLLYYKLPAPLRKIAGKIVR